jgi:rare lipoprotein A
MDCHVGLHPPRNDELPSSRATEGSVAIHVFRSEEYNQLCILFSVLLLLSGCGTDNLPYDDVSYTPKNVTPAIFVGSTWKPYQINNIEHRPQLYYEYRREGWASWYGPGFHKKLTAMGTQYSMYDMTAAHRTLPIPSIVRITNLKNGKSTLAAVTDRGPFAKMKYRIIDVSYGVAKALGFVNSGVMPVRVECLVPESIQYARSLSSSLKARMKIPFYKKTFY